METKTCTTCGFVGNEILFKKGGVQCKGCACAYSLEYNKKHKKEVAEHKKKHGKKYYANNRDKILKKRKEHENKCRQNLSGSFIKKRLREQFNITNPPQELIEMKREQLKLYRGIRGAQNGINGTGNKRTAYDE